MPAGQVLAVFGIAFGRRADFDGIVIDFFAVFLANVPPICVLDEAGALLGDVNVERFCQLVWDV